LLKNVSFRILRYFHKLYTHPEVANDPLIEERLNSLSYSHVEEDINTQELMQFINGLLKEMPELSLRIVELRLVRNKSIKETARKLNIAESTVSNNLSKALATLRQEVALNYGIASANKLKQLLPLLIILMD